MWNSRKKLKSAGNVFFPGVAVSCFLFLPDVTPLCTRIRRVTLVLTLLRRIIAWTQGRGRNAELRSPPPRLRCDTNFRFHSGLGSTCSLVYPSLVEYAERASRAGILDLPFNSNSTLPTAYGQLLEVSCSPVRQKHHEAYLTQECR